MVVHLARARRRHTRGGDAGRVSLSEARPTTEKPYDVAALDTALDALAAIDPRRSQVVELRFFGGLSVPDIAAVLGVSPETVMRDWKLARAWLRRELVQGTDDT